MAASPRIGVGGILTECNHFGGVPIDLSTYETSDLHRGEQLFELTTSVVGGMLDGLRRRGATPLPSIYASACSGGPVTSDCYSALREEWLEWFKAALPLEGLLLPLHGAALVEGLDDPEGDMIEAARRLVGAEMPIVVTLDLHAHVTRKMVENADAILAWETYPHRDQFSTGERAAHLLVDILEGKCRPTMALAKVPVVTSAIHGSTDGDDPFAELMQYTKSLEKEPGVLSTSLFLIHPYMDCEDMGSGGLVITDDDVELAERLAGEVARRYWDRRRDLEPKTHTPGEAIAFGSGIDGGPILLVETADCCGGGAAGDSIASLWTLVAFTEDAPSIVPVVDPEAAAACHRAGEGQTLTLSIGHKLDPRWGKTQEFTGTVEKLTDGTFVYEGGMWEGRVESMGPTAVFRIGSVRVLLMSRSTYDWADEQIRSVGLNPESVKFLVVKNPMNYRNVYGKLAKGVFVLDTPGPTPATLKHVRFEKLRRPYFPADDEIPGLTPTLYTSARRLESSDVRGDSP